MKKSSSPKKEIDKPFIIAVSSIILLLALPVLMYLLQQKQTIKQHAQMTPPPAPAGCYYEPANCSTKENCNPDVDKLICPNETPSPSLSLTPSLPQATASEQNIFTSILGWFKKLLGN